jgi:hypothetical protein
MVDTGVIDSVSPSVTKEGVKLGGCDLMAAGSRDLMSTGEGVAEEWSLSVEGGTVIGVLSLLILSSRSGVLSQHVWFIIWVMLR